LFGSLPYHVYQLFSGFLLNQVFRHVSSTFTAPESTSIFFIILFFFENMMDVDVSLMVLRRVAVT